MSELSEHLHRYLQLVRGGKEITVTDEGAAVARLVPLGRSPLNQLIAEGLVAERRR